MPGDYPAAIFVLMNPSVARDQTDDPTAAWCRDWARANNFFRLLILNVCAYRATDSAALRLAPDPLGPENHFWIQHHLRVVPGPIVLGYGQLHRDLAHHEMALLDLMVAEGHRDRLHALRLAQDRRPWHPLYLPRRTPLIPVDVYARQLTHRRRPIRQPFFVPRERAS